MKPNEIVKVAHLTPSFLPVIGGTEYYVYNLVTYLRRYNVKSKVISLTDTRRNETLKTLKIEKVNNVEKVTWPSVYIPIMRFPLRVQYLPLYRDVLIRYLTNFDIIHFHDDVDLSFPLFVRKINRPKIFTCHSLPYWIKYYKYNPVASTILRNSSNIFHVFSIRDKKYLMKLHVTEDRIVVIPHGVDTELFKPKPKYSTNRGSVVIGFLGRISRKKGIFYLLRAIDILMKLYKIETSIRVEIAGPISDIRYFNLIREYVYRMGLTNIVIYRGIVKSRVRFLQSLDIFVHPALEETFGIAILEAMATGLPIIATNITPINEIVVDGKTGFLVPPRSPKDLAEKIYILVTDSKLRRKMGLNARKRVETEYSMPLHVRRILKIYRDIMVP